MDRKIVFVLCAFASVTWAQREASVQVINTLKDLLPRIRQIQDYVITQMTEARMNSSRVVYNFHNDIIDSKEQYVRTAIDEENKIVSIIDGQRETIDRSCLGFVRSSADMNMNLAGVAYTNCINDVDDLMNDMLLELQLGIQKNENRYAATNALEVFRGENIFHSPQLIIDKLNNILEQVKENPSSIADELFDLVDGFEMDLEKLNTKYRQCLDNGTALLVSTFNIARSQIEQICLGEL